jgi:hypothetical protein
MIDCKTTELFQGWTNVSLYPSQCIKEIFQGGCLTDDPARPLALVLSSTSDWRGSFSFERQHNHDLLETLAKTHTVCHRYIQDSSEFNDSLEQVSRQRKIDVLVMRAHGLPQSQDYAKESMSPSSPERHFASLRSSLTQVATIILQSCWNAVTCGKDDFAGFIQAAAPPQATIYAATVPSDRIEIRSGNPPEARFFEMERDVTYRSGTAGYCMNPLESADPLKWEKPLEFLKHCNALLDYDLHDEAVIRIASEAFKSTDKEIQCKAFALFEKLVDKGQAYEAATSIAKEAFKSGDDSLISTRALMLFEELVDKGQAYEAAESAAREASKSTNGWIRSGAFSLFGKLVDKGQAYEAAISAATEASKSTSELIRDEAIRLLEKLRTYDATLQKQDRECSTVKQQGFSSKTS